MFQSDFFVNDKPANASFVYRRYAPAQPRQQAGSIENASTSTTVLSSADGRGTFAGLAVGDILVIKSGGVKTLTKVASLVSAEEITIEDALDLTTATNSWFSRDRENGTADDIGWVDVSAARGAVAIGLHIETIPTNGFVLQIETRGENDADGSVYFTQQYNAATDTPQSFTVSAPCQAVRAGIRYVNGADTNGDISVWLTQETAK